MHFIFGVSALLALLQIASGDFGYGRRAQHTWAQQYKDCAGEWQSPIALRSSHVDRLPLPAVEMISYHNLLSGPIKITNNGHSVELSIDKALSKKRLPYVFGGLLNKDQHYELEKLHFHWGLENNRGSEHTLDGISYPMEMHIVHRNMKYATVDEATANEDGLTVLGIFFQLQEDDNPKLSPILNTFSDVHWVSNTVYMNASITPASLMPHNTDVFYTYKGSLTTPPCSEAVTWIIFPTTVPISVRQMHKFRTISAGAKNQADNFRILQDIGKRRIYMRKMESSFATSDDMINLNIDNYPWK